MIRFQFIRIGFLLMIFMLGLLYGQTQHEDSLLAEKLNNQSTELYMLAMSNPDSAWDAFPTILREVRKNQFWDVYRDACIYACFALSRSQITSHDPFYAVQEAEQLKDSLQKYLEGDRADLGDIYGVLASIYRKAGDGGKMQDVSELSITIYQDLNDSVYLSSAYQNLAIAFRLQGDWLKSLRYNQKSLELWRSSKTPEKFSRIAITHTNAGRVAALLKKWDEAIFFYKAALGMKRSRSRAHAAQGLAKVFLEISELDSAIYYWRLSQRIVDKKGKVIYPTVVTEIEGQILLAQGKFTEALTIAKKARNMRFEKAILPMFSDYARGESKIALAFEKLNQSDSALVYLEKALAYLTIPNSKKAFPDNLMYKQDALPIIRQKIGVLQHTHRQTEALDLSEVVVQLIQQLRRSRLGEANKLVLNEESKRITEIACSLIGELLSETSHSAEKEGLYQRAWRISEAYHGAILVDDLWENEKFQRVQLPDSLRLKEQAHRWKISFYKTRFNEGIRRKVEQDSLQKIQSYLFEEEEKYRLFRSMLAETWPIFQLDNASSSFLNQEISFSQIPKGQKVISYFEGQDNLFILTYHAGKSRLLQQKIPSSYDSWTHAFANTLTGKSLDLPSYKSYTLNAEKLYRFLLQDVLQGADIESLLLIPDGSLNRVPFEALISENKQMDGQEELPDFRNLPYLITQYEIRYIYALSILENRKKWKPDYDELAVFAPIYSGSLRIPQNAAVPTSLLAELKGIDFSELTSAYKGFFRDNSPQYAMIHLALHGESDTTHASQSYLQFPLESGEDNRLYTHEIYNLRLPSNLISLASCEVGDGRLEAGEGLMSLGRAFRYAGAATVLSSRWKADARVTGRLFPLFYHYLAEGKASDEAFALARRDFLQDAPPSLAHPFYWANFAHWGEAYERPVGFRYAFIFGGIVLLLLMLAYGYFQKKSK